jgi:uncharacterized membrane protein SpoIIM required for sporulation
MKVSQLLESRKENWRALERLCGQVNGRSLKKLGPQGVTRFAALYRAACADLALADAYQLPPGTVHFLHNLVGRAHNQLYRSQRFNVRAWSHEMFQVLPRRLCRDRCLALAFVLFWGVFLTSLLLAYNSKEFTRRLLGEEAPAEFEENFSQPIEGRSADDSGLMVGYYINHNNSIGLECFAYGLLLGVGGLFATVSNAGILGAVFGHMLTVPERTNFLHFVTAHGPFELTSIVLFAAGGMRLGFSMINTQGLSRMSALREAGRLAMPVMGLALALMLMANVIEGFLSPSSAPYAVKAGVALFSTALIVFYVIGLGLLRRTPDATR